MRTHRTYAALAGALMLVMAACEHINDDRIPPAAVRIPFNTIGDWTLYGVAGAGSYRYFIRSEKQPSGYPYTALTYTGYGGVLLVSDIHGTPVAYDLSCPVECKQDVRIHVLPDELKAQCEKCQSVYDIVTNHGQPLSGPAAEHHYGLEKYYVGPGMTGEYMLISR